MYSYFLTTVLLYNKSHLSVKFSHFVNHTSSIKGIKGHSERSHSLVSRKKSTKLNHHSSCIFEFVTVSMGGV